MSTYIIYWFLLNSLDTSRETDHWIEEPISNEIFQHALHRKTVDPEGDAQSTEVKAAADHIFVFQQVREDRVDSTSYTACKETQPLQSNWLRFLDSAFIIIYLLTVISMIKKKKKTENLGLYFFLTWPEVKAIKAKGAEVISHPIATPGVAPCGPGQVALRAGPAHAQVSGLGREKGLHVIHSQLIVPSPGLGWILARSQEYVWSHAVVKYWTDSAKAEKVKLASAFFGYADENQYGEKNHKLENLFGMIAPDHSTTCPATYYLAIKLWIHHKAFTEIYGLKSGTEEKAVGH